MDDMTHYLQLQFSWQGPEDRFFLVICRETWHGECRRSRDVREGSCCKTRAGCEVAILYVE